MKLDEVRVADSVNVVKIAAVLVLLAGFAHVGAAQGMMSEFTVNTTAEWNAGTLENVTVSDGTLSLVPESFNAVDDLGDGGTDTKDPFVGDYADGMVKSSHEICPSRELQIQEISTKIVDAQFDPVTVNFDIRIASGEADSTFGEGTKVGSFSFSGTGTYRWNINDYTMPASCHEIEFITTSTSQDSDGGLDFYMIRFDTSPSTTKYVEVQSGDTLSQYGNITLHLSVPDTGRYTSKAYNASGQRIWDNTTVGGLTNPSLANLTVQVSKDNFSTVAEEQKLTGLQSGTTLYDLALSSGAEYVRFIYDLVRGSTASVDNTTVTGKPLSVEINLSEPENTTYYDYDVPVNISTRHKTGKDYTCNVTVDGSKIAEVNQSSPDLATTDSQPADSHTLTTSCEDTDGVTASKSVDYTVRRFKLFNREAAATVYETENRTFNGSWRVGDMVSELTTILVWNGSVKKTISVNGSGVRWNNRTYDFSIPLVTQNRTNVSWHFNYTGNFTYENGTATVQERSGPAVDQEIWLAYFVENFDISTDRVVEALDVPAAFDIVQKGDAQAETNSSITYNGTSKTGTSASFQAYVIGNQSVQTVSTSASGATTFTFKDRSKTLTTAADSVTVHNKILTDCSAGSASQTTALTFTARNEENRSETVDAEIDYNFDTTVLGRDTDNFAFQRQGESVDTCIYPSWAEYRITGPIQYRATDYTDRTYRLYNATLTNQSTTYDLYLLPESFSTPIFLNVEDNSGNPVGGVTIKVMRYFIGENSYITIAKSETDSEGVASTYLRVNEIYYKYLVTRDGQVLLETDRQILQCTSTPCTKTLVIDPETVSPYFETRKGFSWDCRVNEATATDNASLQCTVNHRSGSMQRATLTVEERGVVGWTPHCNVSVVSAGQSMVCQLGNLTQDAYTYDLKAEKNGFTYTLETDVIDRTLGMLQGQAVYAAFVVFLAVTGMGLYTPALAIVSGLLGFLAAAWLGLMSIGLSSLAAAVVVGLISAVEARE